MKEIEPYHNDFTTDRAERLYFTLNKLHYLEDTREKGQMFGTRIKVDKKTVFVRYDLPAFIKGVQHCVFSLREDLVQAGRGELADEIIFEDKKQHTVPIPEVFL